jgi:hypothetical protein
MCRKIILSSWNLHIVAEKSNESAAIGSKNIVLAESWCIIFVHLPQSHPLMPYSSTCHKVTLLCRIRPLATKSPSYAVFVYLPLCHTFIPHSSTCHYVTHLYHIHPLATKSPSYAVFVHLPLCHTFIPHSSTCHKVTPLGRIRPLATKFPFYAVFIHLPQSHPLTLYSSTCHKVTLLCRIRPHAKMKYWKYGYYTGIYGYFLNAFFWIRIFTGTGILANCRSLVGTVLPVGRL